MRAFSFAVQVLSGRTLIAGLTATHLAPRLVRLAQTSADPPLKYLGSNIQMFPDIDACLSYTLASTSTCLPDCYLLNLAPCMSSLNFWSLAFETSREGCPPICLYIDACFTPARLAWQPICYQPPDIPVMPHHGALQKKKAFGSSHGPRGRV